MRDAKWQEDNDDKWAPAMKAAWHKNLEEFLRAELVEKPKDDDATLPKICRLATFDLACSIDHQLVIMCGKGLASFQQKDGETRCLSDREHLTITWDTGSDNVCLSSWLLYKARLRCSILFDPHAPNLALLVECHSCSWVVLDSPRGHHLCEPRERTLEWGGQFPEGERSGEASHSQWPSQGSIVDYIAAQDNVRQRAGPGHSCG